MKTAFTGTINGKEFDNVQDYNTEMQRCIAEGKSINAHAHTKTVDASDDSFLFPGFAQCESLGTLNDAFIDVALSLDSGEFVRSVNDLLHDRILPEVAQMPEEQLSKYDEIVNGILKYLDDIAAKSNDRAEQTIKRLQEIEKELDELKKTADDEFDRKSVIDFVASLYNSIADAISVRKIDTPAPKDEDKCQCCSDKYTQGIEGIKAKARELFGL